MQVSSSPAPLDAAVIREAASWLVRLHSGEANAEDYAAFERWRRARPENEQAWKRAERLSQQFGAVPPELGVPILTRRVGVNRRAVVKTLAALGVAVPGAWLGYRALEQADADNYRTAVGENRKVMLADGSRVQLNTATELAVLYSDGARLLQLRRGEIYIETAADANGLARPFLVDTAHGSVRALGTRFTVRQWSANLTAVTVLEHRVEVTLESDGSRRIVDTGETLRFSANAFESLQALPAPQRPAEALPTDPPSWTRGMLQADNMRLDAFLEELSRYRPGIVRCDPAVAGLRVSGGFRIDDSDHVLAIIGETLPVRIVRRTPYWVTVTGKP